MSTTLFKQIELNTKEFGEDDMFVHIRFPKENLEFRFGLLNYSTIEVEHVSQAVVAAVTGKAIKCKDKSIEATNKVFDWLGIEYVVEYNKIKAKTDAYTIDNGVISFF